MTVKLTIMKRHELDRYIQTIFRKCYYETPSPYVLWVENRNPYVKTGIVLQFWKQTRRLTDVFSYQNGDMLLLLLLCLNYIAILWFGQVWVEVAAMVAKFKVIFFLVYYNISSNFDAILYIIAFESGSTYWFDFKN